MRELGIDCVRIGEFAWSKIEPSRDEFSLDWLERAIQTLADAQLKVVMCTPTACPPKWLVEEHPSILPVGVDGKAKGFGSRRHYCFSSQQYLAESSRIVTELARRYGRHPAICGWQIDNELGHHGTTLSHSADAISAFRDWLRKRYQTIDALNRAWGNVFWSMEYPGFASVEPPGNSVTEPNPSLQLAWRRFSSAQVVSFSGRQAKILREFVGEHVWLTTNLIGNFFEYDQQLLTEDLDLLTWDSYPLGFLEQLPFSEQERNQWRQTGHPDLSGFHHDLLRGATGGRWGVMEQQPGPVNWAPHNAAALPGMVRFWGWEALAHGAELMSYFRWQQAPFAQEQMHSGLNHPDGTPATASAEVAQLAVELQSLDLDRSTRAPVALLFDYPSQWVSEIQPQDANYNAARVAFDFYRAARQLGLDVDVISPRHTLDGYRIILVPAVLIDDPALAEKLSAQHDAAVIFGPRASSKSAELTVPEQLAPGSLQQLLPLRVTAVDTLRVGAEIDFTWQEKVYQARCWLEHIDSPLMPTATTSTDHGVLFEQANFCYLATLTNEDFLVDLLSSYCAKQGVRAQRLPAGLRLRRLGQLRFAFNFGPQEQQLNIDPAAFVLGKRSLGVGELAAWREPPDE